MQELHGLKSIVTYLHCLPANKKNVPELIKDPVALIKDVRTLVEQHRHDSSESAVTGKPVLKSQFEKVSRLALWHSQIVLHDHATEAVHLGALQDPDAIEMNPLVDLSESNLYLLFSYLYYF